MKEPVGLSIKPSERTTNINLSGNRGNHVEGNRIAGFTASIHTRFCPLRMRSRSLRLYWSNRRWLRQRRLRQFFRWRGQLS